jgi:hypothetical protein
MYHLQSLRFEDSFLRSAIVASAFVMAVPASAECGLAESGSCVVPHAEVGCNDAACCGTVCNADPFCCDVGWDEYCAGQAVGTCGIPAPIIHVMAFGANVTLPGGIAASACDLAAFDTGTGAWSVYFDGDDVGLTGQVIRAATRTSAGDLLIATDAGGSVAGLSGGPAGTAFGPCDLLRFTPVSLGENTAGSWNFHFDGSDVGLTGNLNYSFRGVTVLADGAILLSTKGNGTLPGGVTMTAHDVIRFQPTSLGSVTAGTWSMHFDGSDVGLTTTNEQLDSVSARPDGSLTLSTRGSFAVAGVSGGKGNFFRFLPTSLGIDTAGSYVPVITAGEMSIPGTLNPQAGFEILIEYPDGPRPGGGGGSGPTTCGGAGTADCCVTSLTPYCADSECCETICAIDPLCCIVAWDEYCVAAATNQCAPCMLPARPVMAFGLVATLPEGLTVSPCDLASYDIENDTWAIWFDGDDVGLTGRIVRAGMPLPDGDFLFVLGASGNLPGLVGGPNGVAYERSDILRFSPTSLGDTTAGTWSFHFDGSDVGLGSTTDMAIRSLSLLADGSLVISTHDAVTLPGVGGITANDLVRFTPTSLGAETAGTWEMYFDGSDVGLTTANERIDVAFVRPNGRLMLSTRGSFAVPGLSGTLGDLFDFIPTSTGATTAGSFEMWITAGQMGLAGTTNPQGAFMHVPTVDIGNRPLTPVLFDRLPSATISAAAVEDGHAEYIIVYQGVDPNSGSTGLINPQLVIDAIRQEHGDDPSGYGILDFESPFIERLEAGPTHPNWQMTVDTVVGALQAVKAEFPNVKWTMYSMPLTRYWIPPANAYSWANASPELRESAFVKILTGFDPVLRECDWLNPSAYDRYELSTFSSSQQATITAQEIAHREAVVEVCNRFNATSGLPRKPIIPMVSPMFWKVGQISYNMKQVTLEEMLRDSVRPLIDEGADSVALWTGLPYWVRLATSAQDFGLSQLEARHAFTQDFLGGIPPADWTAPGVHESLSETISEHISARLDEIRVEIYELLVGSTGP